MKKFLLCFVTLLAFRAIDVSRAAVGFSRSGAGIVGQVNEDNLFFSDITTANASLAKHGLFPKLSGGTNDFIDGEGTFRPIDIQDLVTSFSPASLLMVGSGPTFLELTPGASGSVLRVGDFGVPGYGTIQEISLSLSDTTTLNADATRHGFLPKLSGNATDLFLGDGSFADIETSIQTAVSNIVSATDFTEIVSNIVNATDFTDISAVNIYASADLVVEQNSYLRGQTQFGPGGAGGIFEPTTATLSVQKLEVGPIGSSPTISGIFTATLTDDMTASNIADPTGPVTCTGSGNPRWTWEFSISGAEPGDTVLVGIDPAWASLIAGNNLNWQGYVESSGVVKVIVFSDGSGPINPASGTMRATVIHFD